MMALTEIPEVEEIVIEYILWVRNKFLHGSNTAKETLPLLSESAE